MKNFFDAIIIWFASLFSNKINFVDVEDDITWDEINWPIIDPNSNDRKIADGFTQENKRAKTPADAFVNNISIHFGEQEAEEKAFHDWVAMEPNAKVATIEEYRKLSSKEKSKFKYNVYFVRPTLPGTKGKCDPNFVGAYCAYYSDSPENKMLANSSNVRTDVRHAFIMAYNIKCESNPGLMEELNKGHEELTGTPDWRRHVSPTIRTYKEAV